MNDVDRDPANIFPDQTVFLELLRGRGSIAASSYRGRSSISTPASAR
jgi:hypothetical protein